MTLTVLIVDDAVRWRDLLRLCCDLDDRFVVAGEAADGEQALAAAHEIQPDAIVLDLDMPVVPGLQALPRLRAAAPLATIVAFSSSSRSSHAHSATDLGADGYVEKGNAVPELLDVVAELHARRASAARPVPVTRPPRQIDLSAAPDESRVGRPARAE